MNSQLPELPPTDVLNFISRITPIANIQISSAGKAWALIDANGTLKHFDEAECMEAAERGDAYARMLAAVLLAERERCALVCEHVGYSHSPHPTLALDCAAAIRKGMKQ